MQSKIIINMLVKMVPIVTKIFFKKNSVIVLILVCSFKSYSQVYSKDTTINLYKFFQKNFDTTFISFSETPRISVPNFYIVAKKRNYVFLFSYENLFDVTLSNYPDEVKKMFLEKRIKYFTTKPDTNQYLLPFKVDTLKRKSFWLKLLSLKAFNLKNDNNDEVECIDKTGKQHYVYDESSSCLVSITKDNIHIVSFYAPDFFEKKCPGNYQRKNIISINKIFYQIFRRFNE